MPQSASPAPLSTFSRCAIVGSAEQPAGQIIAIGDAGFRGRGLGRKPVQRVIGVGDRLAGARLPREHIAIGIIGEHLGARIGIGHGAEAVEAVIGKARGVEGRIGPRDDQAGDKPVRRIGLLDERVCLDREIRDGGLAAQGVIGDAGGAPQGSTTLESLSSAS